MNTRDQGALIHTNKPTQTTNIVDAAMMLYLMDLLLVLVLVARPLLSPVRLVVLRVAFEPGCSYSKLETDENRLEKKRVSRANQNLLIFDKFSNMTKTVAFCILYLLLHSASCSSSLLPLTF